MPYENIVVEIEERVATLTINRPKVMNALNEQTLTELALSRPLRLLTPRQQEKVSRHSVTSGKSCTTRGSATVTEMSPTQ